MALFDDSTTRTANRKHQSEIAFSKAISKGFMEELKHLLHRRSERLLPFDEVKEKLELWHVKELGLQTIPIASIIGSQGRYKNFTRNFLPLQENLRNRWKQIENAISNGKDLPPVELYKVCDAYFVKDGHHRISVAKSMNKRSIEARVFEYQCDVALTDKTQLEELALLETYHKFLKATELKHSRNPDLRLTVLGGYPLLMEHIQRHRFYLMSKLKKDVSLQDAAASWYDGIYMPMVNLINENGILRSFPHRTEADFYIWISKYKGSLFQEGTLADDAKETVDTYSRVFRRPLRRLLGKIRKKLGLVKYE